MRLILKPKLISLKHHRTILTLEGFNSFPVKLDREETKAVLQTQKWVLATKKLASSILHHDPQYWCPSALYTNDWITIHGSSTLTIFADETPVSADQQ